MLNQQRREDTNERLLSRVFFSLVWGVPLFISLVLSFSAITLRGRGIFFGCYFEVLMISGFLSLIFSGIVLGLVTIFGIAEPEWLGFKNGTKAIIFFVLHHLYIIVILILSGVLVPIIAFNVPNMGATCM
jgi:hypothetical protein